MYFLYFFDFCFKIFFIVIYYIMKYFLKSSYPCLIKTQNECLEINENDMIEIENEDVIFIYPQSQKIPFYINLKAPIENENFSILKHQDRTIILLEKTPLFNLTVKERLNISGKTCEVSLCGHVLSFETDERKLSYICPHPCKNYKIFKQKNFAFVQFENDLYIYSTNKHKLTHISGDEFELENNQLTVKKNINDSLSRQKNATYRFDSDIVLEKENFMYQQAQNKKELLPYRVMESIKAKDYGFVINSLTEKLKEEISVDQLKSFFGNVTSFLPLTTTEYITLSQNQKNYVSFSLLGDKIDDISIDSL